MPKRLFVALFIIIAAVISASIYFFPQPDVKAWSLQEAIFYSACVLAASNFFKS